jgi:NitT/TauT family transport system permease protein
MKKDLLSMFHPFRVMSRKSFTIMLTFQIILAVWFWYHNPWPVIPNPIEIGKAFGQLWMEGLGVHFWTSIVTFVEALLFSTLLSLLLGFSSKIPIMKPAAGVISKLRFWGLVGLQFIFTVIFGAGFGLKVAILTFGMTVFLTPSIIKIVTNIPKEEYDHARTLRLNDWQVLWYVDIRSTLPEVLTAIQINAAIGFVMLIAVEAIVSSLGGVGALMVRNDKYQRLDRVFAIQFGILALGSLFDWIQGVIRSFACEYLRFEIGRS